jgi:hypothetical protein
MPGTSCYAIAETSGAASLLPSLDRRIDILAIGAAASP